MSFLNEIRRRNVHRVALAYLAGSWLLVQVVETLFPVFGLSDTLIRAVVILLAVGFVPAVILAWALEWTPEGIRRERPGSVAAPAATRRFDQAIMLTLALAVAYLAIDKFVFSPSPIKEKSSVAVLAFEDLSEAGDQQHFADGVAEELLNLLAGIPELKVAGRTSAFSFKGQAATIPQIGRSLQVAHVVEGSVRKDGDRIRVTVKLLDASEDRQIWAESYDREYGDIFAIQDDIAAAVVDQLHLNILGPLPRARRANPEAYALYLQARTLFNSDLGTAGTLERIGAILDRALEIDPDYVDALSLHTRYRLFREFESSDIVPELERLRKRMLRAQARNPESPHPPAWLAYFAMVLDNDLETAARYQERAHQLDPGNYDLLWSAVQMAPLYGAVATANQLGEYLLERDPLCQACYWNVADGYAIAGDLEAAEEKARAGLVLDPSSPRGRLTLGRILVLKGAAEAALTIFRAVREEDSGPDGSAIYPGHMEALHDLGLRAEFDALLPIFLEVHEDRFPLIVAQLYAWIGDADTAFEWLYRHDRKMTWNIRNHLLRPFYRKLHDDPRWKALLEQYQMSEEHFRAIDLTLRMPF